MNFTKILRFKLFGQKLNYFYKVFFISQGFQNSTSSIFFCLWIFGWYVIRIDLELTLCIYAVNCWLFWLMLHVIFLTKSVRKVCVAWRPKKCNNVVVIMISFFIFFPTTSLWQNGFSKPYIACFSCLSKKDLHSKEEKFHPLLSQLLEPKNLFNKWKL